MCFVTNIDIGISQTIGFDSNSYLLDYFGNISTYLKTGAPLYFVVGEKYDYTNKTKQNLVCGSSGCDANSLTGKIFTNSLIANYSTIALPSSSWIDDYFSWLDPRNPCCRILDYTNDSKPDGGFIQNKTRSGEFCPSTAPSNWVCHYCLNKSGTLQRPSGQIFRQYLPWYLTDNPTRTCSKGGHPAYGSAVKLNEPSDPLYDKYIVNSSYFMTYHIPASEAEDFTNCYREGNKIAKSISDTIGHEVFPYSVFYVFYEQFINIVTDAWRDLGTTLGAIFISTLLLTGLNVTLAFCTSITIAMIIVDLMGLMYLWGISLNAIALVNLVMATGLSVEFCSHVSRTFSTSSHSSRVKRAEDALVETGSSVSIRLLYSSPTVPV